MFIFSCMYVCVRCLFYCILSICVCMSLSFCVCIFCVYVCVCVHYLSLCVHMCVSLSMYVFCLSICVYCLCLCVLLCCTHMYARRWPSLFCVYYYCMSVYLLYYIIVSCLVRPLTVCSLCVSQTVCRSLSLYCAKVSARVGRRLACSLFSRCAALTC